MKTSLKEQLKRIGGGHLLNEVSRDKVDVERVSKKMEKSKWFGKSWARAIRKKYKKGVSHYDLEKDLPDYIEGRAISDLFK